MPRQRSLAVVGFLLLVACGGSNPKQKTAPASCTGSPDCNVTASMLEARDELREEQEQQRRADRRAKERDLMSRRGEK